MIRYLLQRYYFFTTYQSSTFFIEKKEKKKLKTFCQYKKKLYICKMLSGQKNAKKSRICLRTNIMQIFATLSKSKKKEKINILSNK